MEKFKRFAGKAGMGAGALLASAGAFAQGTNLSDSVISELTTGKAEILAVGGAILVLVGVVALIRHVRSAAR